MSNERLRLIKPLRSVLFEGGYSNLVLQSFLCNDEQSAEKNQIVRRFYGVIERKLSLEFCVKNCCSRPLNKLDREIYVILLMGAYELLYMDSVPARAAVNEAVELCRAVKKKSACGMVNAVLRQVDRRREEFLSKIHETPELRYSIAPWALHKLVSDYGKEDAFAFLESSFDIPAVYCRAVNNAVLSFPCEVTDVPGCFRVSDPSKMPQDLISHGFYVQDMASQICAQSIPVAEGDTVLDLCAAPGGKSFLLSERVGKSGRVISCDISEKKCRLMKESGEKLGVENQEVFVNDASVYADKFPVSDVVLCDVPCSGYGVIGRRPEIKYKDRRETESLPERQLNILRNAAKYVKKGGLLVYSTCTVLKDENERVTEQFLRENPSFSFFPLLSDTIGENNGCVTLMPPKRDCDGFFICCMRKEK